ncbi:MAG: hypothetical protein ACI4RJ_00815 [Alphaproteobacteria bacterium]
MKKILFILCMFSSVANAEISCEDAGGTLFKGNDKETEYCVSFHGMNWWSANAWCQSLGWELIDVQTECNKRSVSNVPSTDCPQLNVALGAGRFGWSKNTPSQSDAMRIYLNQGAISTITKNTTVNGALCLVK